MRKQQFYVVLGAEAPKRETWQGSLQEAYENGCQPLDYEETTVEDQNGNKVTDVVLLRFAERWKGAAHRYLKKNGFEYLRSQHEGLNMYG